MGFDAPDTRLVVNVGLPYSDWELKQQSVWGGRDGKQSVTVQLVPHLRVSSRPGAILQYCSTAVLQYYSTTVIQLYKYTVKQNDSKTVQYSTVYPKIRKGKYCPATTITPATTATATVSRSGDPPPGF